MGKKLAQDEDGDEDVDLLKTFVGHVLGQNNESDPPVPNQSPSDPPVTVQSHLSNSNHSYIRCHQSIPPDSLPSESVPAVPDHDDEHSSNNSHESQSDFVKEQKAEIDIALCFQKVVTSIEAAVQPECFYMKNDVLMRKCTSSQVPVEED